MLTADYEQAYISSFSKIFIVLKEEYEVYVIPGECENYEIKIKKVNGEDISNYLSISFQKQNGSLIVIASKEIKKDITNKLVKDVALALNENPIASYNFKDISGYIIYHFQYVKENIIIDNKKLLETAKENNEIENLNFSIILDNPMI